MSALTDVMQHSEAKGNDRLVLFIIAACADWRGRAAISNRQIAEFAGVGKSNVSKIIARLLDADELRLLSADKVRGKPCVYEFPTRDGNWTCPDPDFDEIEDKNHYIAPLSPDEDLPTAADVRGIMRDDWKPAQSAAQIKEPVIRQDNSANSANSAKVAPKPPPVSDPFTIPRCFPKNDVGRLLTAAGLTEPPDDAPFFWHRAEHVSAVPTVLKALGCGSMGEAVAVLLKRGEKGRSIENPRRLMDLARWANA